MLTVVFLAAHHEHLPDLAGGKAAAGGGLQVTQVETQLRVYAVAAGFLGQQGVLDVLVLSERTRDRTVVDIVVAGIKFLPLGDGLPSLVAFGNGFQVVDFGNVRTVGLRYRIKASDGAILRLEVLLRYADDVVHGHLLHAIAVNVAEPPVALGDVAAHLEPYPVRVALVELEVFEDAVFGALDLFLGRRVHGQAVEGVLHGGFHGGQVVLLQHVGVEEGVAGLGQGGRVAPHAAGIPVFYEGFVQDTAGLVDEGVDQYRDGGVIRVGAGGDVVGRLHHLHVAHPLQFHEALAVLHGLTGVGRVKLPVRTRNRAELLLNQLQSALGLELTGNDQHRVVRLVVFPVEAL